MLEQHDTMTNIDSISNISNNAPSGAALDTIANNWAPPPEPPTKTRISKKSGTYRNLIHDMRRMAGKAIGKVKNVKGESVRNRTCKCGRVPLQLGGNNTVGVVKNEKGAYFTRLEHCGSVWSCPVCSHKIKEYRRSEIKAALLNSHSLGYSARFVTLTLAHHSFDRCETLISNIIHSYSNVRGFGSCKRKRKKYGIVDIRSIEVTHGVNGWHPHIHLIILSKDKEGLKEYSEYIVEAWVRHCNNEGLKCSPDAQDNRKVYGKAGIASYVSKWDVTKEISSNSKNANSGHRTPFGILKDLVDGASKDEKIDYALFREFSDAFKGVHSIEWRTARKLFLSQKEEKTDLEIVIEEQNDIDIAEFDKAIFKEIVMKKAEAAIISKTIEKGVPGIIETLDLYSIFFYIKDREVPIPLFVHSPL